jgi:hypothetical protein
MGWIPWEIKTAKPSILWELPEKQAPTWKGLRAIKMPYPKIRGWPF